MRQAKRRMEIGVVMAILTALAVACPVASWSDDAPKLQMSTTPVPDARPEASLNTSAWPCPRQLPPDEIGKGFETEERVRHAPSLPSPEEAWVCQYDAFDQGTNSDADTIFVWRHVGAVKPVNRTGLKKLEGALEKLKPPQDPLRDWMLQVTIPFFYAGRLCTLELGQRWMVVYSHNHQRAGAVVVDDFGCRDARILDQARLIDPRSKRMHAVNGVLDGGKAIMAAVHVGREAG